MERKKPEANDNLFKVLHIAPRVREVAPLTDREILQLLALLAKAEMIEAACPIAQRALSKR